ncbi:MAG: peptide chain release factor 1 [Ardenticatenia bacterium]|nr:peptide chain release factor 1 [Ardenticatenia bacterium]
MPIEQLKAIEDRYESLLAQLSDPAVTTNGQRLRELSQAQAELQPLVTAARRLRELDRQALEARGMLGGESDAELRAMAEAELADLGEERQQLIARMEDLLLPRDPRDAKNVIVEIRAGTGGDEAGLFAADLFRMYQRYAERQGWKLELISSSSTDVGGFKELIFELRGQGAYSRLKWESGVHRVQRVPATEAQGRIHTSTATVAVLPEVDEVEINVPDSDIRVDVFRSSGPGGQSVNTTDSAVRVTHLPTGMVISSQDEKSQLQNRRKAMQVLRARLHDLEESRRQAELSADRRSQMGTGERAEKIRTYNYPQSRVTDHRVELTSYRLDGIMQGDIDEFVTALMAQDRAERLAATRDDRG